MILLFRICIGDFIKYTESLFKGFLLYGAEKYDEVNSNGEKVVKYRLIFSRTIRDYVLRYTKKGEAASITNTDINQYLNRCRFFIYEEKRMDKFLDKSSKEVDFKRELDSARKFSSNCVDLFFRLSGLDFYFLRINSLRENPDDYEIEFRQEQQACLDNLFEMTAKYLYFFEDAEEKPYLSELTNLWKVLYREYRYRLSKKSLTRVVSLEQLFLKEELLTYVSIVTNAYFDIENLSGLLDTPDDFEANNTAKKEKMVQKLKKGYDIEIERLEKLEYCIKKIIHAKSFEQIKKYFIQFIPSDDREDFVESAKKDKNRVAWKNYLIDKVIKYYYEHRNFYFLKSVMYLKNFENALEKYESICLEMWCTIITLLKMEHNSNVLDCLICEYLYKLISEIDETFWFLKLQIGDLYIE